MCLIILGLSRNASRDAFRLFNEDPYPTLPNFYSPTVIGFAASLIEVIGFAASLVEEIKEILLPSLGETPFCGTLLSHTDSTFIVPIFIVPQK